MSELLNYGLMADRHWREHCPRRVRELERKGLLRTALLEAQERTLDEMEVLMRDLQKQGLTADQAHSRAWELVREKYILLPVEAAE